LKRFIIDYQRVTGITKKHICNWLILNKEFLIPNALITSALRRHIDYQRVMHLVNF